MREAARSRLHTRVAKALTALACAPGAEAAAALPWLLARAPAEMAPGAAIEAATAPPRLAGIPPPYGGVAGAIVEALLHAGEEGGKAALRGPLALRADATLITALVGFANGHVPLATACSTLRGPADAMLLARVALRRAVGARERSPSLRRTSR